MMFFPPSVAKCLAFAAVSLFRRLTLLSAELESFASRGYHAACRQRDEQVDFATMHRAFPVKVWVCRVVNRCCDPSLCWVSAPC